MWRRVGFVRTDVSEECVASILMVERSSELGTLAVTNRSVSYCYVVFSTFILSTLKMEATHSSETAVLTRPARRPISEDGIFHTSLVSVYVGAFRTNQVI
jgi:hypothetical protein